MLKSQRIRQVINIVNERCKKINVKYVSGNLPVVEPQVILEESDGSSDTEPVKGNNRFSAVITYIN